MSAKSREMKDLRDLQVFDASDFLTSSNRDDYLGRGGFAAVRKCKHPKLKSVVVKCFMVTGTPHQCDKVLNEISREAKALSHLDHKNIVKVHGLTTWQQGIYQGIVMEFMEGGNLSSLILLKDIKNIPWKLRLRFCLEIAEGLAYLHYNGSSTVFIHGDMKPENILLTADLEVKIADFGAVTIAQATGATHASIELASTKQHTMHYAAPEFLRKPTNLRTRAMDIYSTAMIFYEILTRRRVFGGVHPSVVHEKLLSHDGLKPNEELIKDAKLEVEDSHDDLHIFNVLEAIMKQCWDLDPAKRLSVREVCRQLNAERESMSYLDSVIQDIKLQKKEFQSKKPQNQLELRNNHLNEFCNPFISCYTQSACCSKATVSLASITEKALVNDEEARVNESYAPLVADALSPLNQSMESGPTKIKTQILIVGNKRVGKSCIISRLLRQRFEKNPVTSGFMCKHGSIRSKDGRKIDILLWDLGGDFKTLLSSIANCPFCAIIYAYDITNDQSFQDIKSWLQSVNKYRKKTIIQMLVGNKCDLEEKRNVSKTRGEQFAKSHKLLFYETSAIADTNIQAAFDDLLMAVEEKERKDIANGRAIQASRSSRQSQHERSGCSC